MSEFVIDATDEVIGDDFDAREWFGPRLREEVVRCRDCENLSPTYLIGLPICRWFGCMIEDVNGFCKWGKGGNRED